MKYIDYRERLGIGFCDADIELNIKNNIRCLFDELVSKGIESKICYKDIIRSYYYTVGEYNNKLDIMVVCNDIMSEAKTASLISKMVAFVNCCAMHDIGYSVLQDAIPNFLDRWNIEYELIRDRDGVFIFPKGAPELDEALVSAPLEWLNDYPDSRKAWIKALKEYANQTDENASDIADKFRKALETFLKEFFHTEKNMNELRRLYGTYLKSQGIPGEVQNGLDRILDCYDKFMNNYAKHNDRTSRKVLEYIMYETGNVMRLLITLKQEETSDAD